MKFTLFSLAILVAAAEAGTNKTEAPTVFIGRPTLSPSNPPITPFPTEETPEPTPSPTLTPVRTIALCAHMMQYARIFLFARLIEILMRLYIAISEFGTQTKNHHRLKESPQKVHRP